MSSHQLDDLTPAEIILLEEHLKLGHDHLRRYLTEEEKNELIELCQKHRGRTNELEEDRLEVGGNFALSLNSGFTAVFGGLMALSSFWGLGLDSFPKLALVVGLAAIFAGFAGYQAVKGMKQRAMSAIQQQLLQCVQLEVLDKIEEKRRREREEIGESLDFLFFAITGKKDKVCFKTKEAILDWTNELQKGVEKRYENSKNMDKAREMTAAAIKNIVEAFPEAVDPQSMIPSQMSKKRSIFQKLAAIPPAEPLVKSFWTKDKAKEILVGLIPSLLGGASSAIFYFRTAPDVLQRMGSHRLAFLLTHPNARLAQLVFSFFVTLYFGICFFHFNKKAFHRDKKIENAQKEILQKESKLTLLDARLAKMREAKSQLQPFLFTN